MALTYLNDIDPVTLIDYPDDVKLSEARDPRGPNTSDFTLQKEDHTVANMLRMKLHTDRRVKFAGYKVPHPTKHDVIVKVQTVGGADGSPAPTPAEALDKCLGLCIDDVDTMAKEFDRAFKEFELKPSN